jgi:hypothetical protein
MPYTAFYDKGYSKGNSRHYSFVSQKAPRHPFSYFLYSHTKLAPPFAAVPFGDNEEFFFCSGIGSRVHVVELIVPTTQSAVFVCRIPKLPRNLRGE